MVTPPRDAEGAVSARASTRYDARDRSRSRSPDRERRRKKQGGFRWKEKSKDDTAQTRDDNRGGRLERGYNDRYREERREYDRNRDRDRDRDRDRGDRYRDDRYRRRDEDDDRRRDDFRNRDSGRDVKRSDYRDDRYRDDSDRYRDKDSARDRDNNRPVADVNENEPKKEKKKKKDKTVALQQQLEMIVVHVNDRLGTKAAIACLPSDPIKIFKMQVAAQIGREPHEILLKRQGERPFKDQLTLEDYGVSNGAQLDLEVDTGD